MSRSEVPVAGSFVRSVGTVGVRVGVGDSPHQCR